MTQDQFVEIISSWLRGNKQTSDNQQISADTELLGSGLLDSFDFLDLIVHIESQTGRKIDLSVLDPNEFATVRGLWTLTLSGTGAAPETHGSDRARVLRAGAEV
jgi:acyl carrier protein